MVSYCGAPHFPNKYTYICHGTPLPLPHYRSLSRRCCRNTLFLLPHVAIVRESQAYCKTFISTNRLCTFIIIL